MAYEPFTLIYYSKVPTDWGQKALMRPEADRPRGLPYDQRRKYRRALRIILLTIHIS